MSRWHDPHRAALNTYLELLHLGLEQFRDLLRVVQLFAHILVRVRKLSVAVGKQVF